MTQFDTAAAIRWIERASDVVADNADRLTKLDTVIGDGDHGANLTRGLQAAVSALADQPPESAGKALIAAGRAVVSKTGGASGPLYGTGFRRAGKALAEVRDGSVADTAQLADALQQMLDGIRELGGASEGDKTMVDALAPAVAAMRAAADNAASPESAVSAAADAADAGRAATVPLQARKGRASYLGERSIGHEDPGAASMTLVIRALAQTLEA